MAFTVFSKDLVYYDILTSDADKYNKPYLRPLYEEAVSNIKPISFIKQGGNSSKLLSMARAEAVKELALLKQVFNVSAPSSFDGPEDVKALTEAINSVFHFRQVYERNKAMLTSPEFKSGIKAVFSWYPTYFVRFFSKQQKTITNRITETMATTGMTLKAATKQVMEALLPEINFKAVRAMLTEAKTEVGVDNKYQQAYREIFNAIQQDFERGINNPFLEGIRKTYGLDKIVREMTKQVNHRSKNRLLEDVSSGIKDIDKKIKGKGLNGTTVYAGGGYTFEHLIDQVLAMTIKDIQGGSNGNIKWTAQMLGGAGGYNAQPDNVLVITEDPTNLLKTLENDLSKGGIGEQNRDQAVKAFSNMSNNLSKLNSGFVVYFNDKNYNIGNSSIAHKAGDMTLEQLQSVVGPLVDDINQAIYNILQMAEGSIGEELDESTSTAIAQAIAYFLFDDYNTIGNFSTGGNSVHVIALEGIMIPLSAYLYAMGKALDTAGSLDGYVSITITPPNEIDFGEGVKDESRPGGARFYRDNWYKQQEASLKSARVKATFLRNLSSMVRSYLV